MPIFGLTTMNDGLRRVLAQARFNTLLMSLLGATGLVLAAIGIYSVIAWLAAQRAREIGVRMALGASATDVVSMMTSQGLKPVIVGLVVGLAATFAVTRVIEAQLFNVSARDPLTLADHCSRPAACGGIGGRGARLARDAGGSGLGASGLGFQCSSVPRLELWTLGTLERNDRPHRLLPMVLPGLGWMRGQPRARSCERAVAGVVAVATATSNAINSPGSPNRTPSRPSVSTSVSTGA